MNEKLYPVTVIVPEGGVGSGQESPRSPEKKVMEIGAIPPRRSSCHPNCSSHREASDLVDELI